MQRVQVKGKVKSGRGGWRPGAGRPRGSATKKTREVADKATEAAVKEGKPLPLNVILEAMYMHYAEAQKHKTYKKKAVFMEKATTNALQAAPFMHPRLQAIAHTGPGGDGPVEANVNITFHKTSSTKRSKRRKA